MALMKFTCIFEQKEQGWSESYVLSGSSPDPYAYRSIVFNFCVTRIAMCGAQTYLTHFRVTNLDTRRLTYLEPISPPLHGNGRHDSDAPDTCLLGKFSNAAGTKSKITFFRGIWDDIVVQGGRIVKPVVYNTLLLSLNNYMNLQGIGWLGINTKTAAVLKTLVQNANGTISGTLLTPLFLIGDIGQKKVVRFAGISQPGNLNGSNPIFVTGVDSFATVKRIAMLPWSGDGNMTLAAKQVIVVQRLFALEVGERKAGRVFGSARGRQPVRKRA